MKIKINKLLNSFKKRIYYGETDAGKVVYFGNLCNYIEMGTAEWFREFACSFKELNKKYNLLFVMKEVYLKYTRPIYYDEEITIKTSLENVKFYSVTFNTIIEVNEELRFSGRNTMIPVNTINQVAVKVPEEILKYMEQD